MCVLKAIALHVVKLGRQWRIQVGGGEGGGERAQGAIPPPPHTHTHLTLDLVGKDLVPGILTLRDLCENGAFKFILYRG